MSCEIYHHTWERLVKVWIIYNGKIEVVSSVIESGRKFNIGFKFEVRNYVDRIHPIELDIKDTTDTARSTSYLD